jgi:hypothetical protein
MTHHPRPYDHTETVTIPTPFGHLEWRIDRRDLRASAVARAALRGSRG